MPLASHPITILRTGETLIDREREIAIMPPANEGTAASCLFNADQFTTREREVLALIANGNTMRQIARALRMSVKTVATHRYNIQQKVQPHRTADLTRAAIRMGLIDA